MENFSNEAYYLFFSALANRTRLAIIDILNEDEKSVVEISNALKQESIVIRKNLEILEQCIIIRSKGSEKNKLYSLNKEILEPLSEILEFHTSKHCPGLTECITEEKLKEYMKHEAAKKMYIEHG